MYKWGRLIIKDFTKEATQNGDVLEYFNWMCSLIHYEYPFIWNEHIKLLHYLFLIPFTYKECLIELDCNRVDDGLDLRYRFEYEQRCQYGHTTSLECINDCRLLELLVALALRCEEHIMDNLDIGPRTSTWFWTMIESMGLIHMTDDNFDASVVEGIVDRFVRRQYDLNGSGGLFTVENCTTNMRDVEIWYQMCMYLNRTIIALGDLV